MKGLAASDLGFKPPGPKPSQWHSLYLVAHNSQSQDAHASLQSLAPSICWPILYQDCKPSGMLQALNFHEILGPLIVRQTEGLMTNSSPPH